MTSLGPTPAPRLELLRTGDRDPRQRERQAAPRRDAPQSVPQREAGPEAVTEFEREEGLHRLDERA